MMMSRGRVRPTNIGSRVLVDPELLPGHGAAEIAVLPLLFDRIVLPEPTPSNLVRWGLNEERVRLLIGHKIILPIATGTTPLDGYPEAFQLTRGDVLPDEAFLTLYQEAIQADMADPDFDQ